MANDLAAMIDRIDDELARGGSDDTRIQAEILSAIGHYEQQRFWFTEGQATASTVAGQANIAVPTDLLEPASLALTDSAGSNTPPMTRRSWDYYLGRGGSDATYAQGTPCEYTYFADQFWFLPTPDAVYTLTLSYVKTLGALATGTDTNAWMTDGEELVRSRAAAAVNIRYLKDGASMQEAAMFAARGEPYLSVFEKAAHKALLRTSRLKAQTGTLIPNLPSRGVFDIQTGWYR